jgi:hypothetical protein
LIRFKRLEKEAVGAKALHGRARVGSSAVLQRSLGQAAGSNFWSLSRLRLRGASCAQPIIEIRPWPGRTRTGDAYGYRAIGGKVGRTAQLWSRNLKEFARRFPAVTAALEPLPNDTVIDGEIVALMRMASPHSICFRDSRITGSNRLLRV